ncbi:hypothetical protein FOA43_002181 [Brettanomyces nanus]|uniref:Uncharacterized protein n=1 Tax=Eeniella nana TaxID=13502 RepID=A0A875S3A4_EENNA|nr:uncharacterized protein FOA43_002181 [Brettanomyces nanus]QPG74845.1 hypothetical protein FOA43_002181 [Brettanomyces nanus]
MSGKCPEKVNEDDDETTFCQRCENVEGHRWFRSFCSFRHSSLITLLVCAIVSVQLFASWYAINISAIQLSNDHISVANSSPPREVLGRAYLGTLETNMASNWSRKYSSENQLAGTNLQMVNWTRSKFEEFGFDTCVDEYEAYVSYPEDQALNLLSNNSDLVFRASLKEDYVKEDPASAKYVPSFLGYAASGNVTASYVFCNYGTYEDFALLDKLDIDLKGKVAVIRYGQIFRGLKVKFAQQRNMSAVLLFSDPIDDGNITEANGLKPYPKGPSRNPSSVERGSTQFLSDLPGDPLTPGYGIKPGENKTHADPLLSTPRIPALPVSIRDITPILNKLNGHGPKIEGRWSEGLIKGFDYSIGPNPAYLVNVYNKQNFTTAVMHNVLAKLEGHNPHEVIIIGNHHDSWTPSAGDPHSGSAVILELARGLGQLAKLGWKPQRTILLASWDGEEYGLLGSTEFGEYNAHKLMKSTVAYINLDLAVSGDKLDIGASPLLYDILKDTTKGLSYSQNQSLYQHFETTSKGRISNLGSGSDFTVFLDHLGIPSADIGFHGNLNSPVYHYHSIYDSYNWMAKLGDPDFKYHNLLSKYIGLVILKMSETKVLPLRTNPYGLKLHEFFNVAVSQVPEEWLTHNVFNSTCPHHKNITVSQIIGSVKHKLGKLSEKTLEFDTGASDLQYNYDHWDELSYWARFKLLFHINRANFWLKYYERRFLKRDGLKNRPWFKHIIFTSGRHTGYSGQQLPGIVEPIEDGDRDEFVRNLVYFDRVITRLSI